LRDRYAIYGASLMVVRKGFYVSESVCSICQNSKAPITCGFCEQSICKRCTEFIDTEMFSFMKNRSRELAHSSYCSPCFVSKVQPAIETYNDLVTRAKQVYIVEKSPRHPFPIINMSNKALSTDVWPDRAITIMSLAFLAAEQGFNAVIKTKVTSRKLRNFGYQSMEWQATGFPALVDHAKVEQYTE